MPVAASARGAVHRLESEHRGKRSCLGNRIPHGRLRRRWDCSLEELTFRRISPNHQSQEVMLGQLSIQNLCIGIQERRMTCLISRRRRRQRGGQIDIASMRSRSHRQPRDERQQHSLDRRLGMRMRRMNKTIRQHECKVCLHRDRYRQLPISTSDRSRSQDRPHSRHRHLEGR